jgi:hypothetical protein
VKPSLFTQYAPYVRKLRRFAQCASEADADEWLLACDSALNGEPSHELRERIPVEIRRRVGAFFTTHELAVQLIGGTEFRRKAGLAVLDPACGPEFQVKNTHYKRLTVPRR